MRSSFLSLAALGALLTAPSFSATLTADYRFNGNLNDSVPGGTALTSHGGTVTAGTYTFAAGQGLSVANLLANDGDYSIGLRFEFDNTSGWRKLVDFKDRGADCGQYVNGGLNFYCLGSGGTLSPNTFYNVVLTRTNAGTYSTYLNGALVWSATDGSGNAVFSGSSMAFFLDDFNTGQSEASGGTADRILIFDGALTGSEVAALDFGAELNYSAVPEPSTLALAGLAFAVVGVARRLWA